MVTLSTLLHQGTTIGGIAASEEALQYVHVLEPRDHQRQALALAKTVFAPSS